MACASKNPSEEFFVSIHQARNHESIHLCGGYNIASRPHYLGVYMCPLCHASCGWFSQQVFELKSGSSFKHDGKEVNDDIAIAATDVQAVVDPRAAWFVGGDG